VTLYSGEGYGEKIVVYSESGMGKSTLGMQAPDPVFIPLDAGVMKLRHPHTGKPANAIEGVETFQDVRDVLHQPELFPKGSTIVIDTITVLQELAEQYMLENIKTERGDAAKNILSYGYNKGYRHLFDTMKLILVDLDVHVKRGVNVLLIAQSIPARIPNPGGIDFMREGPNLSTNSQGNIRALYREWADHVLRIGYTNAFVEKPDKKATKGKIIGETERGIFVQPELWFEAKSRTIREPVVSFSEPGDSVIWQFIFPDTHPATEEVE